MKTLIPFQFIFAGFLVLILCSACSKEKDLKIEIIDVNTQFMECYTKGEVNKLAQCYTVNAKIFPQNRDAIYGHEGIKNFWQEAKERGIERVELTTINVETEGKTTLEEGEYKIFMTSGKEADNGKYLTVWRKEKGKWKMHLAMWNTNHPASEYRLPDLLLR